MKKYKIESKTFIFICALALIPSSICDITRESDYVISRRFAREIGRVSSQKLKLPSDPENPKRTRAATPENLSTDNHSDNDFGKAANVARSRIQRMAPNDAEPGPSSGRRARRPGNPSGRPQFASINRDSLWRRPLSSFPLLEETGESSSSEEDIYETIPGANAGPDAASATEETYDRLKHSDENVAVPDSDEDEIYSKIGSATSNDKAPLIPPSLPLRNPRKGGGRRRFNIPGKKQLKQLSRSLDDLMRPYNRLDEESGTSSSFRGSVNSLPIRNAAPSRRTSFRKKMSHLGKYFSKLKPSYKRPSGSSSGTVTSSKWFVPRPEARGSLSRRRSFSAGAIHSLRDSPESSGEVSSDEDGIYSRPQPGTSRQSSTTVDEDAYEVPRPPPLPDRDTLQVPKRIYRKQSLKERIFNSLPRRRPILSEVIKAQMKKEEDERNRDY